VEMTGAGVFRTFQTYQLEFGAAFKMKRVFSVGAYYRNNGTLKFDAGFTTRSWDFGYAFGYGAWVDANVHTYKAFSNTVFVRRLINEGIRIK
jgi:hypothetical protein